MGGRISRPSADCGVRNRAGQGDKGQKGTRDRGQGEMLDKVEVAIIVAEDANWR